MPINNSGSFFNNFQNGFNFGNMNTPNSPLKEHIPIASIQQLPQSQNQVVQQQTPLMNVLTNTVNQFNNTVKELASLNEQQSVNMVKDLLQFPEKFEQLVTQLTTNVKLNNQQAAIIMLASNMDLSKLSSLLQTNSKEAMSNLYKMIANYNQLGVSMKSEQLSNLTKLISFVSASSASDVQSLKTTMQMYLPWLPLNNPEAFKLEITSKGFDEEAALGIDSVGVLISTLNYGNLQAQIVKTEEDGIKIEVISSQTFPLKDFVELMKEESKRYNININFDLAQKEAFNKEKIEKTQTEVFMNTSPGVNPFLLLISSALIKNVHEIDVKESEKWKNKEIEENGKS